MIFVNLGGVADKDGFGKGAASASASAASCRERDLCRNCLARHPAVGGALSAAETEELHRRRKLLYIAPGGALRAGAEPYFAHVVSGMMKLAPTDDLHAVSAVLFPADFFGAFCGRGLAAVAVGHCELCCFRRDDLLFLFDRHPRLSASFWQHALDALARAQDNAALLRGGAAGARVAAFLHLLARREEAAGAELTMPLSRAEIGELLGLSAETVSRAISKLRADGVIRPRSRSTFSIAEPRRLSALAGA